MGGTNYTWEQMCTDAKTDTQCEQWYADTRERLKVEGLLSENHRRIVYENKLSGSCDTSWYLATYIFSLAPDLMKAFRDAVPGCSRASLQAVSSNLKLAISEDCYTDCEIQIRGALGLRMFDERCDKLSNQTFWEDLLRVESCANIPTDVLEKLVNYELQALCWTWHPPNPLWYSDLREKVSL